jgi:uncharacterized protein (DUF1499 family)
LKILIIILASLILLVMVALFILSLMSQSGQANGLVEAKLTKCPDTPNCLCSEYKADVDHYVEPLDISEQRATEVLSRLKTVILRMGGSINVEKAGYLAATFTSSIFQFVDDLEIRVDSDKNQVQLRSASRVGRGDGGVNRKRIERLKSFYSLEAD